MTGRELGHAQRQPDTNTSARHKHLPLLPLHPLVVVIVIVVLADTVII